MSNLPKAPGFNFVDRNLGRRFHTRGQHVNLDKITNEQVQYLLNSDPAYWSLKFEAVSVEKKRKHEANSANKSDATEE